MKPRIVLAGLAVAALAALPSSLAAQQSAAVQRTSRYHELTHFRTELQTPDGPLSIPTEHEAWITVERETPDSAQAWYDSIRVSADLPDGHVSPDLTLLRGQRFTLRIGKTGHVATLARPDFPAALEGITDLQYQFTDFFPLLPGKPLRAGVEWADTVSTGTSARGAGRENRKIVHYKVAADTTIGGLPAFRLEAASALENRSDSPVPDRPGLRVQVLVLGTEHEVAWVEPDGTMIARRRSAQLGGTMTYVGGAAPVVLKLIQAYDSDVEPAEAR